MKKLFISLFSLSLVFNLLAQNVSVSETEKTFENGKNKCLMVSFIDSDVELVKKEWKSFMKDLDAKVSMKNEIFADNAVIKELSNNVMDVYAVVEQKDGEAAVLYAAFDLGGAYLDSNFHPDKFKVIQKMLYDFAIETSKKSVKNKLVEQEKMLRNLEKEQNNLVKENENLHKDIDDYKSKIKDAETNIDQNVKYQSVKKTEIESQKAILLKVSEKLNAIK